MSDFKKENIQILHQVHLNGGRDFNITSYGIYYQNEFIGEWCKGRRNKSETFSEVMIDDQRFAIPRQADEVVLAVKEKFLKIMEQTDDR